MEQLKNYLPVSPICRCKRVRHPPMPLANSSRMQVCCLQQSKATKSHCRRLTIRLKLRELGRMFSSWRMVVKLKATSRSQNCTRKITSTSSINHSTSIKPPSHKVHTMQPEHWKAFSMQQQLD